MKWWQKTRGFYAIVDPEHCEGRDPIEVASEILRGGTATLQLRAKHLSDREYASVASKLRTLCADKGVPFVVNDRADIAALVNADGLHLGQSDLPIGAARKTVGSMCVGVSTHTFEQASTAVGEGADLIGFGPIFDTATKVDPDETVGIDRLRRVCEQSPVPVIAIGGMNPENARFAVEAGARFVAAISSVTSRNAVAEAAGAIHQAAGNPNA